MNNHVLGIVALGKVNELQVLIDTLNGTTVGTLTQSITALETKITALETKVTSLEEENKEFKTTVNSHTHEYEDTNGDISTTKTTEAII